MQHADFFATRLDVQPHGVADDEQRAEPEQAREHQCDATAETQPVVQARAPLRVVLHQVGFGQRAQRLRE
jgi:hypothetical protein